MNFSLKPLELLQNTLDNPFETSFFLSFLKKELNEENLLALLEIISIKKSLFLTERLTKQQKDEIFNWTETYLSTINIDSKEQNLLKKECATIKDFDYSDNTFFREIFGDLELSMRINLVDPFIRFYDKEENNLKEFISKVDSQAKNIQLNNFQSSVVLNSFVEWPEVLPSRGPLKVVEELLSEILEIINNKKYWIVKEKSLILDYNRIDVNIIKQKAVELKSVSLKTLDENEKLIFFINLYNFLVLESSLISNGLNKKDKKERDNFRKNVKIVVDGKEFNLVDITNQIDKIYSSMTTGYSETVLFSLIDATSSSPDLVIFHSGFDTLEIIDENCVEYLLKNIDFDDFAISQNLTLPFVDMFITSKKKPKGPNKMKRKTEFQLKLASIKRYSIDGNILSPKSPKKSPKVSPSSNGSRSSKNFDNLQQLEKLMKEEERKMQEESENSEKRLSKKLDILKHLGDNQSSSEKRSSKKISPLKNIQSMQDVKEHHKISLTPDLSEEKTRIFQESPTDNSSSKLSSSPVMNPKRRSFLMGIFQKDQNSNVDKAMNRRSLTLNLFKTEKKKLHQALEFDRNINVVASQNFVEFCFYMLEPFLENFEDVDWKICETFYQKQRSNDINFIFALNKEKRIQFEQQ
eukprot:gene9443-1649_t